jgi:hypothetical protein
MKRRFYLGLLILAILLLAVGGLLVRSTSLKGHRSGRGSRAEGEGSPLLDGGRRR